jgi:hypothetical protein
MTRKLALMICDTALWSIGLACIFRPHDASTIAAIGIAASAFATGLVLMVSVVTDIREG